MHNGPRMLHLPKAKCNKTLKKVQSRNLNFQPLQERFFKAEKQLFLVHPEKFVVPDERKFMNPIFRLFQITFALLHLEMMCLEYNCL